MSYKHLKFTTDENVHMPGPRGPWKCCGACLPDYPKAHKGYQLTSPKKGIEFISQCPGWVHAETRISMEAGITDTYRLERCDVCDYEAFLETVTD